MRKRMLVVRRRAVLFCSLMFSQFVLLAQAEYWQQQVNYNIEVQLNDVANSLHGKASFEYINNSPDTLSFIWFHIWPNAYLNGETAFARQLAGDPELAKLKMKTRPGFIDSLDFKSGITGLKTEAHPEFNDVIKVLLDKPLLPAQRVTISTPFHVVLPAYISRSGFVGKQYMICQWYPKPAVYDVKGWHAMPYLDQGEFYSEFGDFEVSIQLPGQYIVGATGELQTQTELEQYRSVGRKNFLAKKNQFSYQPMAGNELKKLVYRAKNVHDFAWFADKDFVIQYDTLQLGAGPAIDVFSFYQPNGNKQWNNSVDFIKDAVRKYSNWLGEYPYPTVAAVEGPKNESSGGMEYPMITLITSPGADKEGLDAVITHEVGHNWFYGILASNERDHPWMDEGLNTYYQFRYEAQKYRANSIFGPSIPKAIRALEEEPFLNRIYSALSTLPAQQAVESKSTSFPNKEQYGVVVYIKTAVWMYIAEIELGKEVLSDGMKLYYDKWKFRHPYPEDLKKALEEESGKNLDALFGLLNRTGNLN